MAIKVCDSLNNCSVKTSDETFYIDTGIVTLALNGDKQITILRFSRYKELGAIATKGNAGRVSERLDYVIEGEVDNSKAGTYYLTYSAGEGQNKVSITREVIVKESKEYLVWFFVLFVGGGIILSLRLIFVKSKKYGKM